MHHRSLEFVACESDVLRPRGQGLGGGFGDVETAVERPEDHLLDRGQPIACLGNAASAVLSRPVPRYQLGVRDLRKRVEARPPVRQIRVRRRRRAIEKHDIAREYQA